MDKPFLLVRGRAAVRAWEQGQEVPALEQEVESETVTILGSTLGTKRTMTKTSISYLQTLLALDRRTTSRGASSSTWSRSPRYR